MRASARCRDECVPQCLDDCVRRSDEEGAEIVGFTSKLVAMRVERGNAADDDRHEVSGHRID